MKTLEWLEKERARCRKKYAIYRQKYPERVKATKKRQRQKPGYLEKCRAQHRRWLEKNGHKFWTAEDRKKHLKAIREQYAAIETDEQRSKRMAVLRNTEVRKRARDAVLALKEKHPCALRWSLISPNGISYRFSNLANFIRSHRHLFTDEQLRPVNNRGRTRIEAAIAMLSPRRKHCVEHCCGWRWNVDGQNPASYLATS